MGVNTKTNVNTTKPTEASHYKNNYHVIKSCTQCTMFTFCGNLGGVISSWPYFQFHIL